MRSKLRAALAALLLGTLGLPLACSFEPGKEPYQPESAAAVRATPVPREPCAHRLEAGQPLFGDLHVHTGYSMDARVNRTIATPDDAYRFARGEALAIPPEAPGGPPRSLRIDRPLDFAAVTDHAEWLGETSLCLDPSTEVYDTRSCRIFRGEAKSWLARALRLKGFRANVVGIVSTRGRNHEVCGDDVSRCRVRVASLWQEMQAAAEEHYDRTPACRFTTFHGYEYSRSPDFTKVHRNVIFRNEIVPELPLSWIDTPDETLLWAGLRRLCNDTDSGCRAIAIPHNPNLSNGQMFTPWYRDLPMEEQRQQARLRAGLEPIVEMMQVKGESECRNGMYQVVGGPDELCGFEKSRDNPNQAPEDCGEETSSGAQRGQGCTSRLDYVRYALTEGLSEQARIGVNPYVFGLIGSTDTHLGNPGAVAEDGWVGSFAKSTAELLSVGERRRPSVVSNPGGLAGVWAEENSREAIFSALVRREAFATSGTRIAPRLVASFDLPADACRDQSALDDALERSVRMGGALETAPGETRAPRFLVTAMRDPMGAALQRIQIVKGFVGDDGHFHQRVVDVAGDANNGASVNPATCTPVGKGADTLCGVYEDPDFDPEGSAVYYARVLENPTCRWSAHLCRKLPEAERPDGCSHPRIPKTIQERAWTSPIWVAPRDSALALSEPRATPR